MVDKISLIVTCMAIFKAGVDAQGVYLSPVRISQSSINGIQVSKEPAPIYEPNLEKKTQADVIQQSIYLKNNYNNAILSAGPKISLQNAQTSNTLYSVAQPTINGYPNTLALLNSYSHENAVPQPYAGIPATKKVEVPLVQHVKTGIVPYSDASVVSHTTFAGLGTSYTW